MTSLKSTARICGKINFLKGIAYTSAGIAVLRFQVSYPNSREGNEWTNINVSIWGDTAIEIYPKLQNQDRVIVEGPLVVRNYTDKKGEKRVSVDLNVFDLSSIELYGAPKQSTVTNQKLNYTSNTNKQELFNEETIPF
jgi:single-stranded DNA-binding protein